MKWDNNNKNTVLNIAKKLQAYADVVHSPTHARIAVVKTHLQKLKDKIKDKSHKTTKVD